MGALLDTSFLVDVLAGSEDAVLLADRLHESREATVIPTPALYEVESGLRFRRSRSEALAVRRTAERFPLVDFDEEAAREAAGIRAELLRLGEPKNHVDVMIAGIAAAGNHRLVTRDADFEAIADAVGLEVETYETD